MKLLKIKEAAPRLGLSKDSVYDLIHKRRIAHYTRPYRISEEEIEAYLKREVVPVSADEDSWEGALGMTAEEIAEAIKDLEREIKEPPPRKRRVKKRLLSELELP